MTTAYDEELTPEFDPPVIEPPPPATLLGRIFAHRRARPTVVRAPLVRVDQPESADMSGERRETENAHTAQTSRPAAVPARQAEAPGPAGAPAPRRTEARTVSTPPDAEQVATRFCPGCDERVPVAADGLHCHLGHRLSGAHRKSKRRWFRRRAG